MMTAPRIPVVLLLLLLVSGACSEATAPVPPRESPSLMKALPCEQDPSLCGGGGGGGGGGGTADPAPSAPGYWLGSTVTPAACFSPTGVGINDADFDGMSDYCENILAERFRPELVFSTLDCNTGHEPYWASKYFPNRANSVRIAYLYAYYEDCGPAGTCDYIVKSFCDAHSGDSEFTTVDVRYDPVTQHWFLHRAYLAAHFNTGFVSESSKEAWGTCDGAPISAKGFPTCRSVEYPDRPGGYLRVWVARNKHGSYLSRSSCNGGGTLGKDDCNSNVVTGYRIRHSPAYNVGSRQKNFINSGACVSGGELVQYYPENYQRECFWVYTDRFGGWRLYPTNNGSSSYFSVLVIRFECYDATNYSVGSDGTVFYTCDDQGVIRAVY